MGLSNIVKSRIFKNFMAKLYGIGASVVIIGALFKINHYPGADYMLIAGLSTEAIIFFFSAFEPPHVEPDWSLVYPELAGMYHGVTDELTPGGQGSSSGNLDAMLKDADIGPELIESLGTGLKSLSDNASKLKDVTDASIATTEFTEHVKGASKSVESLSNAVNKDVDVSETYYHSMQTASKSATNLTDVYSRASESIKGDMGATAEFAESVKAATQSANQLADNYSKSSAIISESNKALDFSSLKENNYAEQLNKISENLASLNQVYEKQLQNSQVQSESSMKLQASLEKFVGNINASIDDTGKYQQNIAALNTVFENQLKGTSGQVETTEKLQKTLNEFLSRINESADRTNTYNDQLDDLSKKVAALNSVYGNMLSAMNVKTDNK